MVLLDQRGRPLGTAERLRVHTVDTPLHLAFSVHIVGPDGRLLVTRRALTKRCWAGVWTNSCCGHPRPGETLEGAAVRRVREELGIDIAVDDLTAALPDFRYRAVDASGVVENEVCPVFIARWRGGDLAPNPREVVETHWVQPAAALACTGSQPFLWSPWFVSQASDPRLGEVVSGVVAQIRGE